MKNVNIDFSKYINLENVNFLSGRNVGKKKFNDERIIEYLNDNEIIINIIIDETKIKGINDSFIKGFFSEVFEKLKKKEEVYKKFKFNTGDYFKRLIDKNFNILESLQ